MDTDTLTVDAEEQAMRDLGRETDAEQGREPAESAAETPEPQAPEPTPEPQPEVEQPPEAPVQEIAKADTERVRERQRDEAGKFVKPETDYSKAVKEEERKDRSWRALQAEKEQFRTAQTQWEEQQRMAQLEATRQQYQPLKKEGLTAQEYYQGAQRFEQEGDHENALKAYKVASEMAQAEQQRYGQMQEVEAEYQWRLGMQQAGQAFPEIWNPDSPISAHLQRIIGQNPWIYRVPQGFQRAAEVANMLTHEGLLKEKEDEIIVLKAELEKYRRKGQPAKGGYAAPRTGEKDFDEMGLDEMEAHLKGLTAEADNYR